MGILIGILIYSLILSIITLYKDNSSYFIVETLDIIIAGPCLWIIMLILAIIRPIYRHFYKEKESTPYESKSDKYIEKIVRKIVKIYKKHQSYDDIFDFTMFSGEYNCNDIEGWKALLIKKARYERLNRKFKSLMWNSDKDRTIAILKPYFTKITEQFMKDHNYDEWFILTAKDKDIYILTD